MPSSAFSVDDSVLGAFPGMRIVVVTVRGMVNTGENAASRASIETSWRTAHKLSDEYPNPQSIPRVGLWREALRAAGINPKKYPVSIEAMVRRALKSADPLTINPLTDVIHSVSLDHLVPVGGFDLDRLDGDFRLARTRGGETFRELGDGGDVVQVEADEIAYLDDEAVQTRQFVWRQAQSSLVRAETTDAVVVAEVLGEVGPDVADRLADDLRERLRATFGLDVEATVVDERTPSCGLSPR